MKKSILPKPDWDKVFKNAAENAIKWIDALPNYKQGKGRLYVAPDSSRNRSGEDEFCCLGVGCHVLGLLTKDQMRSMNFSSQLEHAVGLKKKNPYFGSNHVFGDESDEKVRFFGKTSVADVNDETRCGFKRFQRFMKTRPECIFIPEVAKLVKEHYNN